MGSGQEGYHREHKRSRSRKEEEEEENEKHVEEVEVEEEVEETDFFYFQSIPPDNLQQYSRISIPRQVAILTYKIYTLSYTRDVKWKSWTHFLSQ